MTKKISNCRCPDIGKACRDRIPKGKTIEEMVEDYRKKWYDPLTKRFSKLTTFTDFICGQPNILEASEVELPSGVEHPFKFCKNSHQYRMPSKTIKKAEEKLKAAGLEKLSTFEEIYKEVKKTCREVDGFGILAVYDFCARYCFSRGILPERVYLQAGAYDGAKYLKDAGYPIEIERSDEGVFSADLSTFPKAVADLTALYAEDFLCIYKSRIKELSKQ